MNASLATPRRGGDRPASPVTTRSIVFVDTHREAAAELGVRLAGDISDPEALAARLRVGLQALADP